MEVLVLRFPLFVMARKQGVQCPGVAQITWAELFQCWWAVPWRSLPCWNQYLWKPAWPSVKVQSVACGIPSVKALPKEVAGDGRLCCCAREKEHPAELAASIPAGKCGDKRRALPRHSGKSRVCATAECLDGWQQGLWGLPYVSVWIRTRCFPEINFSPFIKLQTDSSSKKF